MPDLEELIARTTRRTAYSRCWARSLEGELAQYISALEEIDKKRPGTVNRQEVQRVLAQEFALPMSSSAVENHFAGKCHCGR
jgi:hypothetical protein